MKFYSLLIVIATLCASALGAQDAHFSQFFSAPLSLSPAMTGVIADGDLRAIANYRNQWGSFAAPFETYSVSYDMKYDGISRTGDFWGFGFQLLNDRTGEASLRTTSVALSATYHLALNRELSQYLSAGFQYGLAQQSIDFTALTFDNQFNGLEFNPDINSNELIGRDQFFYGDLNAGLMYYHTVSRELSYYAGAGVYHLGQPNVSFYEEAVSPETAQLDRRYSVYGGANISPNGLLTFMPRFVYFEQGEYTQTSVGGLVGYLVDDGGYYNDISETILFVGGMYRFGDAVIPMVRLQLSSVTFSASYDVNTSALNTASAGRGGLELAVTYQTRVFTAGPYGNQLTPCPRF